MLIHNALDNLFKQIASIFSGSNGDEIKRYLKDILKNINLNAIAQTNRQLQNNNPKKAYPRNILAGEIYFIAITDGVGSELIGDHLGIVVQNKKANIYSSKVNIVPIEGDGSKINQNYNVPLSNSDLDEGHLNKDPSRIITTDILTVDKCRLKRKIGKVTPQKLEEIKEYIRKQLDI